MRKKVKIKTEEEIVYPILEWKRVENFLLEKTLSGFISGLIDAHKILDFYLKKKGYPGKNIEERINLAKEEFSNWGKLMWAKQIHDNLVSNPKFNTTSLDLEDAILAYKQAIIDITQGEKKKLKLEERILVFARYYFPSRLLHIKKIILYIIFFFLGVLFLADTALGNLIVSMVVDFTHLLFSYLLAIILFVIGLVILTIGTIFYLEKKRKENH